MVEFSLNTIYEFINSAGRERTLLTGFANAQGEFIPDELLTTIILLNYKYIVRLHPLIGSKASSTSKTLPSSPYPFL
jgi:hypothetical protein